MNYFPNSAFLQIQINEGGPKNKLCWKNTWKHAKRKHHKSFQVRVRWNKKEEEKHLTQMKISCCYTKLNHL